MAGDSPEAIKAHVRVYVWVFLSLMALTALTVAVSYFHFPHYLAVFIGLAIASFKASLVGGYFMHLIGERKIIWYTLILTLIFFLAVMLLPLLTDLDNLRV